MKKFSVLLPIFNNDRYLEQWFNIPKFENIDIIFFDCNYSISKDFKKNYEVIDVSTDFISEISNYINHHSGENFLINFYWNCFNLTDIDNFINSLNFNSNYVLFFDSQIHSSNNGVEFELNLFEYFIEQVKILFHGSSDESINDLYQIIRKQLVNLDLSHNIFENISFEEYSFYIRILNNFDYINFKNYEDMVGLNWNYINKEIISKKLQNFKDIGINSEKRDPQIIISLTSFPERIDEVSYCIYSLLNQNLNPDKIILWLAQEQFPKQENDLPKTLLNLKDNGLTINWCNDIKSYKKLIPTLKLYPDDIIVTVDDDIYYPEDWLENMLKTYEKYPNTVISSRGRNIKVKDKKLENYDKWSVLLDFQEPSYLTLPTGAGGTLYCPHALSDTVFNEQLFNKLCPTADDMWFWAMAVLNRTKITCIEKPFAKLTYVNIAQEAGILDNLTLWQHNQEGHNDIQFNNILDNFPEILEIIIDK